MELPEVDAIGLEPAEAVFQVGLCLLGGPAADLGHEEDLVASAAFGKGLPHPLLGAAVVVVPAVIHEGDPLIDGPLDQPEASALGEFLRIGAGVAAQAEQADHLPGLPQRSQGDASGVGPCGLLGLGRCDDRRGGKAGRGGLEEFTTTGTRVVHGCFSSVIVSQTAVLCSGMGRSLTSRDPAGSEAGIPRTIPRRTWYAQGWRGRPAAESRLHRICRILQVRTMTDHRNEPRKSMKLTLDYGRTGLTVELPADRVVGPLAIRDVPALDDPERDVAAAIEQPIGTPALRQIAQGRKDACILICDITRPVPNRTILRPMLEVLQEAGIPRERDPDPGRHRAAPTQHSGRKGGDARRGDPGRLSGRGSLRHPAGGAHARRHDVPRNPRLDRHPICPGRPEDRDGTDRAAPDGRLLGRPQADLPGSRRARDGQALARPRAPRTPQRRLRHPRREPGPRGEHRDRPDGRLRLHRQRHAR